MKNSVGQAVRGENFWNRENELASIWDAIESGSHILLVAPRRVGKTSIMFNLQDNPQDGYIVVYVDTESADSENEFWQKLFNALMAEDFTNSLKVYSQQFWTFLTKIKIKKVSTEGVEFGDGIITDYATAFERLVKELDGDKKLIIMVDEFAQTVENIIKYEDDKSAESFLRTHQVLRKNPSILNHVTFIYAGSIGLESVVAKIASMKFISDLNSIKVNPLTFDDAEVFTEQLCKSVSIKMSNKTIIYLLEKIEWLIPFYIQLLIQELKTFSRENNVSEIDEEIIELAIKRAIDHKNYFEHWRSKLKEGFKKKGYLFSKEILNTISEDNMMTSLQISNIATKHELDDDYAREIIHSLVYDGYINNHDNVKEYRFNSPILKLWWYKNVAN